MQRPHRMLRALAVLAGLLAATAPTAPAAAEHPELAPTPFATSVLGEDGCTVFTTAGEASWPAVHPPETDHVAVTGSAAIAVPGAGVEPVPCLPVVPFDRQIEFTGYVEDRAVDAHVVPLPADSWSFEYAFELEAPDGAAIDFMTVSVCQERRDDGSSWSGRCGETVRVEPGGGDAATEHCTFSAAVVNAWSTGYTMTVTINAIEPISDWYAIITLPDGQVLVQVWNTDATQSGSQIVFRPAPWNGEIPAGGSAGFGFVVSGSYEPPPHIEVWADGIACSRV